MNITKSEAENNSTKLLVSDCCRSLRYTVVFFGGGLYRIVPLPHPTPLPPGTRIDKNFFKGTYIYTSKNFLNFRNRPGLDSINMFLYLKHSDTFKKRVIYFDRPIIRGCVFIFNEW